MRLALISFSIPSFEAFLNKHNIKAKKKEYVTLFQGYKKLLLGTHTLSIKIYRIDKNKLKVRYTFLRNEIDGIKKYSLIFKLKKVKEKYLITF